MNVAKSKLKCSVGDSVRVHKFGAKYRFKGPWDAFGKHLKSKLSNLELQEPPIRCGTAYDCYVNLSKTMEKREDDKRISKLLDYEALGDARVLQNTTFTTSRTFLGYATEDREEFERLVEKNPEQHIVFTDRINKTDM